MAAMRVRAAILFIGVMVTTSCERSGSPVLITSIRWRGGEVKVNDYSSGIDSNYRCDVEWHGPDGSVTVLANTVGRATPGIEIKGEELWIGHALGPEQYRTIVFSSPSQKISDRIDKVDQRK